VLQCAAKVQNVEKANFSPNKQGHAKINGEEKNIRVHYSAQITVSNNLHGSKAANMNAPGSTQCKREDSQRLLTTTRAPLSLCPL
jgi:hypothetical protein